MATTTRIGGRLARALGIQRAPRMSLIIPWLLLGGFLLASLVTTVTQAHRYGITVDEPLQQAYGVLTLAWYRSRGQDMSFLTRFPRVLYMPEHGAIFDVIVVAIQSKFTWVDPWLVRHIVTGLTGWLGVVAIALCGLELGGPWVALAAALGLWLYPRYYGAIYNNPKDVPAAVSMLFVLWATLLLLKHWERRPRALEVCALLGLYLGVATAIRMTAIDWFAVLAVLLAGWWVANARALWRERRIIAMIARQAAMAGVVGGVWFLATMALWPFIFIDPLPHLIDAYEVLSHFPWNGAVLFEGATYPASRLPESYVPVWLVIGSPPILLAFALLGFGVALAEVARRRRIDPAVAVVELAFVLPLAALLVLHPELYDTLRQFLFIIPPLVLLAAYGLARSVSALVHQRRGGPRWAAIALLALTMVSYAFVITDMVALSPYEYIYFSPLVGGLQGAAGQYDTDYWGACGAASATWLAEQYHRYTDDPSPTVDSSGLLTELIRPYLPGAFRASARRPDFFIGITRYQNDHAYPDYRVIHVVAAEGVPLCVVKVNPAAPTAR